MNNLIKDLGNYFIDISKLTFGGVVLSVILEIEAVKSIVLLFGFIATVLFALAGFVLLSKKKED